MLALAWIATAFAGDVGQPQIVGPAAFRIEDAVVPSTAYGYEPAGPERKAVGPDRIAAGPDGAIAIWDPIRGRVLILDDLVVRGSFASSPVDDLAFVGSHVILLCGRTLYRVTIDGTAVDHLAVPEIVPTAITLDPDGSRIWGVDAFGNRHAIADIGADGLVSPHGRSFAGAAHVVSTDGTGFVVDGQSVPRGGGLNASVRALDGGWALREVVAADHPITVIDTVFHDGRSMDLPVAGRTWTPSAPYAIDAQGRLITLEPRSDGLHVRRISP